MPTAIQQIPAGWKMVQISDICKILSGSTPKTSESEYWDGSIPWFTPLDLSEIRSRYVKASDRKITEEGFNSCSAQKIPPHSLIMSSRAPIGYFAINLEEATTNQGCKSFACSEVINVDFLYYYLNQNINQIKRLGSGSTFAEVNKKQLESLQVIIPFKSEQTRIAAILSKVDEEIEKVERIIEQTEKLKKGLMQRLLTKGIGHTKFKKTELGEIPEEWEVKKLGKIIKFENGKAHEKFITEDGSYVVINSKFISSDGTVLKYSNENLKPLSQGDITMVMSDVPNGLALGKCFLVPEDDKYTLNQRICSLRPIDGDSQFYFYVLNRNQYFLGFNNGVGQTNLRKNEVLECPLLVPPPLEQKQIAKIIESIVNHITVNQRIKSRLLKLKKGLMNDLLSGKVRIIN